MKIELTVSSLIVAGAIAIAQTPAGGPILRFTATTDNVSDAHESIRIDLLRWSTDAERDQLLAAWNMTPPAGTTPAGRGGGRGGAAAPQAAAGEQGGGAAPAGRGAAAGAPQAAAAAGAGGGTTPGAGRGAAGRAGRAGRGRGGEAASVPRTPEAALASALAKAPTVGYLWSSEAAGYSVRYAVRLPQPDGSERIILITDRPLGEWNDQWKPVGSAASAPANDYEFSLIELQVNAKGEGEGKASLTGKVTLDGADKTIALENFGTMPVIFRNVKRKTG